jgi:hypothetical protein
MNLKVYDTKEKNNNYGKIEVHYRESIESSYLS